MGKEFDKAWQARFEELGRSQLPSHSKATYYSSAYFGYREIFLKHVMNELLSYLNMKGTHPCNCLDVGCGEGLYTKMLHDRGLETQGVDAAESLIRTATSGFPEIRFQKADAYELPFEDRSFDCVVSFGLLQCLADWRRVIEEVLRVLRPRGIAAIETNRAFPVVENVLRSVNFLVRNGWRFKDALAFFRIFSASLTEKYGLRSRKLQVGSVVQFLRTKNIRELTIHNPVKHWPFHDYIWAWTLVKPNERPSEINRSIKICSFCRKFGIRGKDAVQ